MAVILTFFAAHWALSVFMQTFYLHRYAAHRMFTMSPRMEKFFHLLTFVFQGSSYLRPSGYAILHREHHAFSDTDKDPHSPHTSKGFGDMMWKTALRYGGLWRGTIKAEERFYGGLPTWPALERLGDNWVVRIGWGTLYTLVYIAYAPHWAWFALVPVHYLMGPIHGAIVNWGGHMYGYRNFDTDDKSKNSLPFDFLTLGELFQNNHHRFGQSVSFAARWFEIDPTYVVIKIFAKLGIIQLVKEQKMRWPDAPKAIEAAAPVPALVASPADAE
ncbi:MAG TPA: acyl-CoA desaturase [Polyangiaceae bacterium]|nr:acyl-CoA desaturase [Polyangiaceae bacterium]